MKRLLLMIFTVLAGTAAAAAPPDSSTHLMIGLNGGAGVGIYRDAGLSPLAYRGLEIHPSLSLDVRGGCWRYEASLSIDGGAYGLTLAPSGYHAFGGQATVAAGVLRRVYATGCWLFWLGAGVDDVFDLRYNPQFSNSSVGISNFARLQLSAMAEAGLGNWTAWGRLWFTPVALMYRPGFAYISNFDRDAANPVSCAFDQYRLFCAAATGISSQLGIKYRLPSGNEVGLSYRWHHITSRTTPDRLTAPHRFDQASHALLIHLLFSI